MQESAPDSDRDDQSSASWDSDMDDIPLVMEDSEDECPPQNPHSSQSPDKRAPAGPPGLPGFSLRLPLPGTSAETQQKNNSSSSSLNTPRSSRQARAAAPEAQATSHAASSSSSHVQPAATPPPAGPAAASPRPPASAPPAARTGSPEGGARGRPALRLHLTMPAAGASPAQSPRAAPAATAVVPGGQPASLVRCTGDGLQPPGNSSGQQELQVVLLLPAFTLSAPQGAPPGAPLTPAAVTEALRRQLGVQPAALQYYHLAAPGSLEAVLQAQQQQQQQASSSSSSAGGGEGHTPGSSHMQRPPGAQMQRQMSRLQQHSPSPRQLQHSSSSSRGPGGASSPATQEQPEGRPPAPPLLPNVVAVSLPGGGFNLGSLEALLGQVSALTSRAKEAEEAAAAAERLMVRHQINVLAARHEKEDLVREASAARAAAAIERSQVDALQQRLVNMEERVKALTQALDKYKGRSTTPSPAEPGSAATTPTYAVHSRRSSFDGLDMQQPGIPQAGQQQQQQQQQQYEALQQQQQARPWQGPPAGGRSQPRTPGGSASSSTGGGRPPRSSNSNVPGVARRVSGPSRSSSDGGSGSGSVDSSRRQSGGPSSEQAAVTAAIAAAALGRVAAAATVDPVGPLGTAPFSTAGVPGKGPAPGSLAADGRSGEGGLSYAAVAAATTSQASPPSKASPSAKASPNAKAAAAGGGGSGGVGGGIAAGHRHLGGRARSSS